MVSMLWQLKLTKSLNKSPVIASINSMPAISNDCMDQVTGWSGVTLTSTAASEVCGRNKRNTILLQPYISIVV